MKIVKVIFGLAIILVFISCEDWFERDLRPEDNPDFNGICVKSIRINVTGYGTSYLFHDYNYYHSSKTYIDGTNTRSIDGLPIDQIVVEFYTTSGSPGTVNVSYTAPLGAIPNNYTPTTSGGSGYYTATITPSFTYTFSGGLLLNIKDSGNNGIFQAEW
ncbi:MAG: hypothetical protein JW969_14020 [Spirochaetales bacterium]|nr:hypothetical protein [Spirochaetales bacterium]